MKAMVLKEYNQPLVYCEDYPDPVIREENDVIIKITACGLCTTDLKVQHGVLETGGLPRILGHEPAGVVTAVGSRVTNVKVGDRVISSTYMACRTCENCRRGRVTLCENLSGRLGITVDGGFAENEPVDVVIRPEDIDIVPVEQGQLVGTVTNVTFKGMQYDIIVDFRGFKWLIQTTDHSPVGARIGVKIDPEGFHIMKKSEYSGMFGDYSSYSEEYEELADASAELEEEESEDEE